MRAMIEVQPVPGLLGDFARWATAQTPKVRTVSPRAFAVPDDLFTGMPEELLIGALVDGQRYRSPAEDAANGTPPPGGELLGVATPEAFAPTGNPETDAAAMVAATPPDPVDRAMTAALVATDLAASNAARVERADDEHDQAHDEPADEDDEDDGRPGDAKPFACDLCPRAFPTERGRDSHRRQAHSED